MSFHKTKGKIEEAHLHIKALEAVVSLPDYKSRYSAAVNALGSIWDTLKAEGKGKTGFEAWKEGKWQLLESDPLLHSVREWRNFDYHTGKSNLVFGSQLPKGTTLTVNEGEPPIVFGGEGLYRIVNEGMVDEERLPAHDIPHTIQITIVDPPKIHLGKGIVSGPPESYLVLALDFYKELVFEATKTFSEE